MRFSEEQRHQISGARGWSGEIGCCSDESTYAMRIYGLFRDVGLDTNLVPGEVLRAVKDLDAWEECAGPCETINKYLEQLLREK